MSLNDPFAWVLAAALSLPATTAHAGGPGEPGLDPAATNVLLDALRRFSDGSPVSGDLESTFAKRLSKVQYAKKTAKSIIAAIDARLGKPKTALPKTGATKAKLVATAGVGSLAGFQPHRHMAKSKL